MSQLIHTEINQALATVTLTRPDLHNAFNDEMIAALADAFIGLDQNPSVRAIILAAEGKSFCAGADLNWMRSMVNYSFEKNLSDAQQLARMLNIINECSKPVIGRIHGAAYGGGVGLVSVCDMAVALETATFCLSEVRLGLLPSVISPFVLPKVQSAHARRYFITAERFSAEEAHRIGLVSTVVSTHQLMDEVIQKWLEGLFQNGPEAISLCKKLIRDVSAAPTMEDAIQMAATLIAERRISDEGQEGMRAFLEKRPSKWLIPGPTLHVS